MSTITCSKCGSVHKIQEFKTTDRDDGSITCEVCGEALISWNGGVMYKARLLERRDEHKGQ